MQNEPGNVVALIGNSGVGKSSLAQAGVIAALKRQEWPAGGAWPAALAESRSWLPLTIRPEDKPLKALALTFTRLLHERSSDQDEDAEGWVRRFRDGAGFADLIRAVKDYLGQKLAGDTPRAFLLYIDQGEEIYASTEREGKPDIAAKRDAEAFSRVIAEAAGRADCRILFSLRSDYYGSLQDDNALFAVTRGVDVPPMPVEALRQAIERPATALGVRFEPPAMPGYLAGATAREAGALPLLAYLLSDMWREMQAREDELMRFGERFEIFDVSAALRERAERYRVQNKPRDGDLKRLFTLRLAQVPRLGDVIKRRARRAECSAQEWDIAEELAKEDWRLVTLEGGNGEITAEVAHEELLRKWPALEDWLSELRDFLTWKAELEAARAAYEETPTAEQASALLSGRRLLIARNWLASHGNDFADVDRAFVEASIKTDDELRERARQQERKILLRTRIGAGVAAILALIAGTFGWWAFKQRGEADNQRNQALLRESQLLTRMAENQIENKDFGAAALLALEALPDRRSGNPARKMRPLWASAEIALNLAHRESQEQLILKGHESIVTSVAFSPDGARILTGSYDNTARLWGVTAGEELFVLKGHAYPVRSVAFSPDGARVLTGSDDATARLWDAQTGAELLVLKGHTASVMSVAFSPDGARLLTGSFDSTTRLWDARTGAELFALNGHADHVTSVAFSPEGARFLTGSSDNTARLWDAKTGAELFTLKGHAGSVKSVAFSPDGARILTGSDDTTVRLWDARTGAELLTLKGNAGSVKSVAFSPDGARILTGSWDTDSWDNTARLWDARTGAEIYALKGHTGPVMSVAFSADGARILTGSMDNTVRLWSGRTCAELCTLKGHTDTVTSVAFGPDGARILTGSSDKTARLWDARTRAELFALEGHTDTVTSVAFGPDGARILTGSSDKTARLWDAKTGAELFALQGHTDTVTSVAFGPDGARILTGSSDKTARLWDAKTGTELFALKGHAASVTSAAFSPDGTQILTGSDDLTARLWDARTGAQIYALKGHTSFLTSVAFSPDGARILTGSWDNTARVWDARTGVELLTLKNHTNPVRSVAFSPDGARILTGSDDLTARLWDARTGAQIYALKGHTDPVTSVAFSADGARILTGSDDNTARLWDHRQGQVLIEEASEAMLRCLTADQRRAFQLSVEPPEWCYTSEKWPYDHVTLMNQSLHLISSSDDRGADAIIAVLKRYHPALARETASTLADAYIARSSGAEKQ